MPVLFWSLDFVDTNINVDVGNFDFLRLFPWIGRQQELIFEASPPPENQPDWVMLFFFSAAP